MKEELRCFFDQGGDILSVSSAILDATNVIVFAAGRVIIQRNNLVAVSNQSLTQMRPDKTGAAGHYC